MMNKFIIKRKVNLEVVSSVIDKEKDKLSRYLLLFWLKKNNFTLFSKLILSNPKKFIPLIYTPTIGEVCTNYSELVYFLPKEGLIISLNDLPNLTRVFIDYKKEFGEPKIAILTDGSRVLGLGDLGVNGFPICWGKAQLISIFTEIKPNEILPIIFDCGTDNPKNLKDSTYLGLKQNRLNNEDFYQIMDNLLGKLTTIFPKILIHFEDFRTKYALGMLERYQNKYLCFNDDIQGTGAVVMAGLINAIKYTGITSTKQRILLVGAGSASIGVAQMLLTYFKLEHNLPFERSKELIWMVDSKGLIIEKRSHELDKHKKVFARKDSNSLQELTEIVNYVKPTILIGLSGKKGIFNPRVIKLMFKYNRKPIIFALSNPHNNAECTFAQAMKYTNSQAIFASGTDFPDYVSPLNKQVKVNNQANNMYVFPALEFSVLFNSLKKIDSLMVYKVAKNLAESLTKNEIKKEYLYPDLSRVLSVNKKIALAMLNNQKKLVKCQDIL